MHFIFLIIMFLYFSKLKVTVSWIISMLIIYFQYRFSNLCLSC